jgi:hypothetical protein
MTLGASLSIERALKGGSNRYAINMPVYFNRHDTAIAVIQRE